MEAGFQYHSRTAGSPPLNYFYPPCGRPKTSDASTPPFPVTRSMRFPPRPDVACRYEPTRPRCNSSEYPPWGRPDAFKPVYKQSIQEWVNEQIHLTDRSGNYGQRARPMGKEELRQRMWDELVYEYESEAQKWMHHETEMRKRAQEREREEARRRIVQEDIIRIQARVRERRDSEKQAIAEERRRSVERAREKVRMDQVRAERAMLEAWNVYESGWAAISASSEALGFRDVPWPVAVSPTRVADLRPENIANFLLHPVHSSNHSRRERIRAALLRWHPDRFRRILVRVDASETREVEEGVGIVVRCLNELLAKEGKALHQVSLDHEAREPLLKKKI